MNIQFDNEKDRELFIVLLDNMAAIVGEMEPDEIEFINKVYKASNEKDFRKPDIILQQEARKGDGNIG